MPPAPPTLSRLRSLWQCGTAGQTIELAAPILLDWVNRNRTGTAQVRDLSRPDRYRLTARSHALVAPMTTSEDVQALALTTRTNRGDGQWTTILALVQTPDQAWAHLTVEHSPPSPAVQLRLPQAALDLMGTLEATDGHTPLAIWPAHHHNHTQRRALADALTDPSRLLPLVLASTPEPEPVGGWRLPEGLARALAGLAAIHVVDAPTRAEIHPLLPAGATLRPGRLLVLAPGPQRAEEFEASAPDVGERVLAAVALHAAQARPPAPVAAALAALDQRSADLEATPTAPLRVYSTTSPSTVSAAGAPRGAGEHDLEGERERVRLSTQVERLRGELSRVVEQATQVNERAQELDLELVALTRERDYFAQHAQAAEAEAEWLRLQAAAQGLHQLAAAPAPTVPATKRPPRRVEELLEHITDGAGALPHLVFSLEEAPVHDLALDRAKEPLWVGRAWEALQALEDWCRYREDHPDQTCGLRDYLTRAPDGYRVIPTHRLSPTESEYVRNGPLAAQRQFPAPIRMAPSGRALMLAHIRLDTNYGICPRLYFLPDPTTQAVAVGYLGRHLTNARTS
ncbi:hypothetical protein NE857_21935 [Nocardiopsis exhalans]|uniref:Uncharacterized protein n=1 Tax=Nocardiopsis exhalans TaxID=163604 RepID=A0ABY5D460_9ACTN|nr:hypothetical protein [Nocardiopsis exhalans]USY17979.1 hypothetical protein NE857_21935 [Nocardiopsis exhalans]